MNNGSWPPPLKDWVQKCLAEASSTNKDKVHAELKKVIFEAYRNKTISTTDWTNMDLESLKQQRLREQLNPVKKMVNPPKANFGPGVAAPVVTGKRKKPEKDNHKGISTFGALNGVRPAHENEANEARKKRFAREHDIEESRGRGVAPAVHGMGDLSVWEKRGGKKKFSALGYAVEEPEPMFDPNVIDWDKHTIVGTSTTLEKRYLRLTSEPDPATIRPLPVLIQTLELLKQKWRRELNYTYICDQFKSVRQDLTVQRIKNYFTVSVYEIHARIALESKDLGELNQCQSTLRHLYEHNIPGHPEEFLAYRILYMLHTRNKSELNLLLAHLTPEQREPACVQHALKVQTALATSNYHAFFVLFNAAPNMGAYMMDHFVPRERVAALATMSKAYPNLPVSFLVSELAFEDATEAVHFLASNNADRWVAPPAGAKRFPPDADKVWDCKAAASALVEAVSRNVKVDIKGQL